jgi:hypothetical protein
VPRVGDGSLHRATCILPWVLSSSLLHAGRLILLQRWPGLAGADTYTVVCVHRMGKAGCYDAQLDEQGVAGLLTLHSSGGCSVVGCWLGLKGGSTTARPDLND